MKIVVLDGFTLNPGDLDWGPLRELGSLTVYDRTPEDQVLERAREAEIILTNKVAFDRQRIAALPRLRYLGVTATGYNILDLQAARERDIVVTNVPAYSTAAVAEMVFALLFELVRQVAHHAHLVREGRWSDCSDFSFTDRPQIELAGMTLGIVGFGTIGSRVARIARAFDMRVLAATRNPDKYRESKEASGVRFVELDPLFAESDVVSLHCPLTSETHALVGAERLRRMKPGAFLINTSRGPVVDETALAAALREGRLGGAGLDVLSTEPPPKSNPLLDAPRAFVTPHIAWATRTSRGRLLRTVVANVAAFLQGAPQNVVN